MNKKILTVLGLSALLACSTAAQAEEAQTYTIGICEFIQHGSVDFATQGFMDALTDQLGDRVTFDVQNAQGDYSTCTSVINSMVTSEVDLILANATAALQTAATATSDIPILGTSITEYGAALQLDDFDGIVGGNISGTSDLAPLDEQAAVIKELFPEAETVGLLYCSGEPNSQYQVDVVQEELEKLEFTSELFSFADSNDLTSVVINAAAECDVIYIPTDNTAAANATIIANICLPEGIPVIAGDESTCQICGVATFSIDYYALGYKTGEMAVRILENGEDISTIPVEYAVDFTKRYNAEICEQLGLEIPEDYVALEAVSEAE